MLARADLTAWCGLAGSLFFFAGCGGEGRMPAIQHANADVSVFLEILRSPLGALGLCLFGAYLLIRYLITKGDEREAKLREVYEARITALEAALGKAHDRLRMIADQQREDVNRE
jgi:hypothetical protein